MLRTRKNRRYNETTDEDGERKFNIQDKIKSKRFDLTNSDKHLQEFAGQDVNLRLMQSQGFEKPILVEKPDGLDLRVPPKSFLVRNVRDCVGHDRLIDVMDVRTQKNIEMSMKDWCKYYESRNRDRLLNVISLEFSHTKLDELVDSPMIVKLLDWVDLVWPKFLKESQTESTNSIDKMKYPKVQKYCLMSVKGSYTDFHIDFGGTSVWYHILRGRKIFWMVPPTDLNLSTFEEWTLSGMQQTVFFGDTVEECFRVELEAGNTFFIPSGWIHAVYTLEDSLVFGGNFLHSFGVENQLRVSKIEDSTKVPVKFRYPFYTEILWYVVQHYVYCLTGKDHLHRPEIATAAIESKESNPANEISAKQRTNTTKKGANHNNKTTQQERDIYDESTESEQEDKCDSKKRKNVAPKKRGKSTPATKSPKKPKKPLSDDESTEIDSAAEESAATDKPTTCRMTKNSLLRLQYEVEGGQSEQQQTKQQSSSKSTATPKQTDQDPSGAKSSGKKSSVSKAQTSLDSTPKSTPQTSVNARQLITTPNSTDTSSTTIQEISANLNGWSTSVTAAGPQTGWTGNKHESKEPPRIHLTKYELAGLKALVKHLSKLSGAKKHLPALIRNSRLLLDDCRKLIAEHEHDVPELAVTGKPITPELLNMKRADINEMIKQFFKPSSEIESSDEPAAMTSTLATSGSSSKSKFMDVSSRNEEKKSSGNISSSSNNSNDGHTPKSPQKDVKLSPNKKAFVSMAASSSGPPPPRPKSPPTRPLSNNQYKPKQNNIMLLPGSFADLIAATSTEKKAFDVSGADVTGALFGAKDLPGKSAPKGPGQKIKKEPPLSAPTSAAAVIKLHECSVKVATSSSLPASANTSGQTKTAAHPKSISPEPPKIQPVQKRFINPTFRPHNKEKLIFASAPYVSPVHASEQSRLANQPYPWQTPAPHQSPAIYQTPSPAVNNSASHTFGSVSPTLQSSSTTTPFTANQQKPTSSNLSQNASVIQNMSQQVDQSSFAKSSSYPNNPASEPRQDSLSSREKDNSPRSVAPSTTRGEIIVMRPQQFHTPAHQARTKLDHKSQQSPSKTQDSDNSKPSEPNHPGLGAENNKGSPSPAKLVGEPSTSVANRSSPTPNPSTSKDEPSGGSAPIAAASSSKTGENDQKTEKPKKPRGPPKKSKEARQAIKEFEDAKPQAVIATQPMPMPISVVRLTPSAGIIATPVQTTAQTQQAQTKSKAKRPKKSKNDAKPPITNSFPTIVTATGSHMTRPQVQPSVICGLVTQPPNSTSSFGVNSKMAPQQYLISRPLMFNAMPTISTAQFQNMSRAPGPMITNPGLPSLGMPLQQGARIVWATQPRGTTPTAPSSTQSSASSSAGPSQANTIKTTPTSKPSTANANSDNAALLSLATTALSTAPMAHGSPSLVSHIGARAPTSQAIVVSSAPGHNISWASPTGQPLFRPIMRGMPVTQFVSRPGAPRPTSGQWVFARLPNQNQQARFLITQPSLMTQRFQAPHLVAGQSNPTLAFANFKPSTDTPKAIKTKKVKTS